MQVLSFPESRPQAQQLADALGLVCKKVAVHHFPDGESRLVLPLDLPEQLIFYRSLDYPNDKLVELLLAADSARVQGVKHLTLVAPYLCYMRQDKAFHPGEVVSQKIIGRFLASRFDQVLTVDAHLHRIQRLEEAIPAQQAQNLSATTAMGQFLSRQNLQPLLLGPDQESRQWVAAIANIARLDYVVASKTRLGDRDVRISLPEAEYQNCDIVIVDDVISSGYTVAVATEQLLEKGARAVHCLVTHALFAKHAVEKLRAAGIQQIWSSDSISHSSNVIPLAPLLAEALKN
ncbi:MAG TPA: ribose-phosphate diphosphokinase [Gammaproteobacteria bacterium]|nr:ribose-phosphate diphosphokinase [Gammaproteobacteria bacterium]